MDDINTCVHNTMLALEHNSNYIPQIQHLMGSEYIALQYVNSLRPIASSLFFSKLSSNGSGTPTHGANIQVVSIVNDKIPHNMELSVGVSCAILTNEYKSHNIEFRMLYSPDGLQLVSSFNFTILTSSREHEIIEVLDTIFNIVKKVRGRLGNGVLIEF